jgi:GGDEF domain-containing protein
VGVGASIGVTTLDEHTQGERAALAAADRAMYDIKHGARAPGPPA